MAAKTKTWITSILTIALVMVLQSCQKKSTEGDGSSASLAKVEELKKVLAEQAAKVIASAAGTGATTADTSDPKKLVSIRTSPSSLTLIEGLSGDFGVLSQQANGDETSLSSDVTFSVSPAGIAEIIPTAVNARYKVNALAPGHAVVTIGYQSFQTTFDVIVKAKEVVSVEIYPKSLALGTPSRFSLTALYTNNTKGELTSGVTWQSMDTTTIQSNSQSATTGIFTGTKVGLSGMRATYGANTIVTRIEVKMPRIQSIQVVADNDSYLLGSSDIPVQALATFVGGSTYNIASSVTWTVVDPNIVAITGSGMMEATFPGDTVVKATYGSVSGQATFFVTSENFSSYRMTPTTASTPAGLAATFQLFGIRANATERDITSYVRWTVDDVTTAYSGTTLSPRQPGKIFGVESGTTTVHARYGLITLNATVTVTDAIVTSLAISGTNFEGVCGTEEPALHVDGLLSDGTTRDLTALATYVVDPPTAGVPHTEPAKAGVIATLLPGASTVTITYTEPSTNTLLTTTKALNIKAPVSLGYGIVSTATSIAYGDALSLQAAQIMSCGIGTDFTNSSSWATDNASSDLNTLINATATKGLFSSLSMSDPPTDGVNRTVKVIAVKGSLRYELNITVRPKEARSLTVSAMGIDPTDLHPTVPPTPVPLSNVDVGSTTPLRMLVVFSDNSKVDMSTITSFPGYTSQFVVTDCPAPAGCAVLDPATHSLVGQANEGVVKIYGSLHTPQGAALLAPSADINIQSLCDPHFGGVRAGNYCVWKGSLNASCTQTCNALSYGGTNGTYHPATGTVFGKMSATVPLLSTDCGTALTATGWTSGLQRPTQALGVGVGCALYTVPGLAGTKLGIKDTTAYTTDSAADPTIERICACKEPAFP